MKLNMQTALTSMLSFKSNCVLHIHIYTSCCLFGMFVGFGFLKLNNKSVFNAIKALA